MQAKLVLWQVRAYRRKLVWHVLRYLELSRMLLLRAVLVSSSAQAARLIFF